MNIRHHQVNVLGRVLRSGEFTGKGSKHDFMTKLAGGQF